VSTLTVTIIISILIIIILFGLFFARIYRSDKVPPMPICFGTAENNNPTFYVTNKCYKCYWENCCEQVSQYEKDAEFHDN